MKLEELSATAPSVCEQWRLVRLFYGWDCGAAMEEVAFVSAEGTGRGLVLLVGKTTSAFLGRHWFFFSLFFSCVQLCSVSFSNVPSLRNKVEIPPHPTSRS